MRKFFGIIIILVFKLSTTFCIYISEYSFVGYPQESSVLFLNPAGLGNLGKFNLDISYGMMFRNVIDEGLYNTELSLSYNIKNNFFVGLGYRQLVLEEIYSEDLLLGSFGTKFFNEKIFVALNFKYYIFKYFYDEYYLEDILAENNFAVGNFDIGLLWKISENIFLSFSALNLIGNSLGKDIKYSLPQNYILGLGYNYGPTIFNIEYHIAKNIINQESFEDNSLKLCLKQEVFYNDKISSNLIFELSKKDSFDNFVLGAEIRFLQNILGLKYFWVYPIDFASETKEFYGNHYINLNISFGKKFIRKIKKEKVSIERTEETIPSITEPQKMEESIPKSVELKEIKEQFAEQEIKVTTETISLVEIKKEQPKQIREIKEAKKEYKFPVAHKVLKGETLISISKKYYNNEKKWKKIYEANKDKIIKGVPIVGEILIIPEP